jgi:hypothetical protein
MVDVKMWMSLSNWQYPELVNSTIANSLMYNPTQEAKPIKLFFWL